MAKGLEASGLWLEVCGTISNLWAKYSKYLLYRSHRCIGHLNFSERVDTKSHFALIILFLAQSNLVKVENHAATTPKMSIYTASAEHIPEPMVKVVNR